MTFDNANAASHVPIEAMRPRISTGSPSSLVISVLMITLFVLCLFCSSIIQLYRCFVGTWANVAATKRLSESRIWETTVVTVMCKMVGFCFGNRLRSGITSSRVVSIVVNYDYDYDNDRV